MDLSIAPSIIINPSYGNNPYLRAIEVALAVQEVLQEEFLIVVPHVYGERQKKIIFEQFGDDASITLDASYGELMKQMFFDGNSYQECLEHWLHHHDAVGRTAHEYLEANYKIAMEIGRAPLVPLHIHPSYYMSFSRTSTILRKAINNTAIQINGHLLQEAATKRKILEDQYDLRFITVPGTFEPEDDDIPTPLTVRLPLCPAEDIEKGIYVTLSGMPEVDSMEDIAKSFGSRLYTNDATKIPGTIQAPPSIIAHPNIIAHVARAGWGAAWMSLLTDTPLIVPHYTPNDDPEIFFNIQRLEELGIGTAFHGQTLEEILKLQPGITAYRKSLKERFGNLDGASPTAVKIAENFLYKRGKHR